MIALKSLLSSLQRPDVAEVVLRAGRRPLARVGSASEELDAHALTGDDLVAILFSAGGSRYVETLGDKPAQWRTRVEGVGAVVVSAAQHGDVIEAHFALRDGPPQVTPAPAGSRARASSIPPSRGRAGEGHGSKSLRPPPSVRGRAHHEDAPKPPKGHKDAPPSTRRGRSARASERPEPPHLHLPLPPLAGEIDLEIGAAEIPSVPGKGMAPFEHPPPDTPRTMPEAGFGRPDGRFTPALRSQPRVEVELSPPTPRAPLPTVPSEVDVEAAFELDEPHLPPREPTPPPFPARLDGASGKGRATGPRVEDPGVAQEAGHRPGLRADEQGRAPGPPAHRTGPRPPDPIPAPEPAPVPEAPAPQEPFAPSQRRPPEEPPPRRNSTGRTTRPFAREPHTLLWQKLLRAARDVRASDLHVVAGRPPLYRVAGQIVPEGDALDPLVVEDMILSRVPSRAVQALEAEGSCRFALEDPDLGRFRVNVCCHRAGLQASLRPVALEIPTLAGLGLPEAIGAVTRHRRGLVVVAGPAGHGKSATIAAIVGMLNRDTARHVVTIEDPIEHRYPRSRALLRQREIGVHARSVPAAIEALLRLDAEVLVLDEIADLATARAALAACELGHLVLGTMSAPSAARAIDRLVDLFPPAERAAARGAVAASLQLVVSQRLLPDAEGKRLVAAAGVLPAMGPLATLIREEDRTYQIARLEQQTRHLGVVRLDDALVELVRAGRTTAVAALAVAEAPDEMEALLGVRRPNAPPRGTSPVRPDDPRPPFPGGAAPAPPPAHDPPPGPKDKGFFDNIFRKKGS